MKLSKIKPNPENPRVIRDDQFLKLKNSIQDFPKMLSLRPIVLSSKGNPVVLGGNQRLRALQELGYKDVPDEWVRFADELTEDEKRRFIIQDNVEAGDWDFEILENKFDDLNLDEILKIEDEKEEEPRTKSPKSNDVGEEMWFINIKCDSERHAQQLYERFLSEGLDVKIVT